MTPNSYFNKCAEIENEVSELYSKLSVALKDYPDTSMLFSQIAQEEVIHNNAMRMVARIVLNMDEAIEVDNRAEELAEKIKATILKLKESLDSGKKITPKKALEIAIALESNILETHSPSLTKHDSPQLSKTLSTLVTDSFRHKNLFSEELIKFR